MKTRREAERGGAADLRGKVHRLSLTLALSTTILGLVLVAPSMWGRPAATIALPGAPAEAEGLALSLDLVEWVSHDHQPDPGFATPASMMPGAPAEGSERLHLELALHNPTGTARGFSSQEFRLQSDEGEAWSAVNQPLAGSLGAGQAVNLDLFFDVPGGGHAFYLVWQRGRSQVIISTEAAQDAAHDHD